MKPLPRKPAPRLSFDLVKDQTWTLSDQEPERFTLVVFYRGLHCPVCKEYLQELDQLQPRFANRGVDVVAVSMDRETRAQRAVKEWELEHLPVGYGLNAETAQDWGLYLSEAVKDEEPDVFSEPGLFLIEPDQTLFYAAVNSMPYGRPRLSDILKAIDFVQENNYPARGEVGMTTAAA